jgi:hypothetical protein
MFSVHTASASRPSHKVARRTLPRQKLKSVQEVSKQNLPQSHKTAIYEGAGSRIRTDDLLITNQLLYQLSYAGVYYRGCGFEDRLELRFSRWCSTKL